jgi:hypothetical protein
MLRVGRRITAALVPLVRHADAGRPGTIPRDAAAPGLRHPVDQHHGSAGTPRPPDGGVGGIVADYAYVSLVLQSESGGNNGYAGIAQVVQGVLQRGGIVAGAVALAP